MSNNLRQAAQQALEALEILDGVMRRSQRTDAAIAALRQALAEPEQERPHPDYPCRSDGRCQYAIDSGAEGLGHCPPGKCCMAATLEPTTQEIQNTAENLALMKRMFPQPEQEPVAWIQKTAVDWLTTTSSNAYIITTVMKNTDDEAYVPLYTAPTPRKPPAYAGVTAWIGDATVTYCVTRTKIECEYAKGMSMESAAELCLKRLAAHGIGEQHE